MVRKAIVGFRCIFAFRGDLLRSPIPRKNLSNLYDKSFSSPILLRLRPFFFTCTFRLFSGHILGFGFHPPSGVAGGFTGGSSEYGAQQDFLEPPPASGTSRHFGRKRPGRSGAADAGALPESSGRPFGFGNYLGKYSWRSFGHFCARPGGWRYGG